MSEASERTMLLLKELVVLKEEGHKRGSTKAAKGRKRRKEICDEIKQLAAQKKVEKE